MSADPQQFNLNSRMVQGWTRQSTVARKTTVLDADGEDGAWIEHREEHTNVTRRWLVRGLHIKRSKALSVVSLITHLQHRRRKYPTQSNQTTQAGRKLCLLHV